MDLPTRLGAAADAMNRRPRLWLTVFALLMAVQISPWWYPSDDGCTYLSLARCVAGGEPLAMYGHRHSGVPPGYPLLVGPAFLLGDQPFLAISFLHWLMAVALMLGVYHWARRHFPEAAVLAAGLVLANGSLWYNYRRTLKEIAFLMALVWAANALDALLRAAGWRDLLRRIIPAAVLLVLVILIRYSGIVLFAGFGAAVLLKVWHHSTRRAPVMTGAAVLGVTAVAALGLLIYAGGHVYLQGFTDLSADFGERIVEGVRVRISDIGRVAVAGMFKSYADDPPTWVNFNMAVFLPTLAVIAVGWWHLGWRRQDVLTLTLPFYFGLYVVWPYSQGARFMVAMVPVLVGCLWFGLQRFPRHRSALFIVSLAAHLGASLIYWVAVDAPRAMACDGYWGTVETFAAEIRSDMQPVAVRDVPGPVRNMLELTLDRHIAHTWTTADPEPTVQWIMQARGQEVPEGFAVQKIVQDAALLRRVGPVAAAPPPVTAKNATVGQPARQ